MDSEFMKVSDAATEFSLPKSRIYQWLEAGKLNKYANKFDKTLMIKVSELQAVIASQNEVIRVEE